MHDFTYWNSRKDKTNQLWPKTDQQLSEAGSWIRSMKQYFGVLEIFYFLIGVAVTRVYIFLKAQ